MADDTIASGGSFTLSNSLTGGTNIDFLNDAGDSGTLVLEPSAFQVTSLVSNGGTSLVSIALGGSIVDFQPGDTINVSNLESLYAELDFAPSAAANNASFDSEIELAAGFGGKIFDHDGTVTGEVFGSPISIPDSTAAYVNNVEQGVFGSVGPDVTLTISLQSDGGFTDGIITANSAIHPCFLAGTSIATPEGEIAVEDIVPGTLVLTRSGAARPVRWLGRSTVSTRFADPLRALPIRIRAGALAAHTPARDLLISPDHALFLDGMLVQAAALVNGCDITRETDVPETFTYYHVETASHELILAENTWTESFIDNTSRMNFDNWAEYQALGTAAPIAEMPYPRVKSARQLPAALRTAIMGKTAA